MTIDPNKNEFLTMAIIAAVSVISVLVFGFIGATLNEAWSIR